jgi:hypothetical protein
MPMLILSYPSIIGCPQCRAVTKISLVEPDLEPLKERHTFACEQCRSSCIYLIDREARAARQPGTKLSPLSARLRSSFCRTGHHRLEAL